MLVPSASRTLLVLPLTLAAATYSPSTGDFPNPERGFLIGTSYDPLRHPAPLDAARLRRARENGLSLVRMSWVLSEFRGRRLSGAMLDRIRTDFATARACGVKVIGRFEYNFGPTGAPDAPLDLVLTHLDQLRCQCRSKTPAVLPVLTTATTGPRREAGLSFPVDLNRKLHHH